MPIRSRTLAAATLIPGAIEACTQPSSIAIRRARKPDLQRILELLDQLTLDPAREPDRASDDAYASAFAAIEADPTQTLYVAELDGAVVGTATLYVVPNLTPGARPSAIAENVVVDARVRGRGVGAALMRAAIDEARAKGCFRLKLSSNNARVDAHRFYERLGFERSNVGFKLVL